VGRSREEDTEVYGEEGNAEGEAKGEGREKGVGI